jgi:hypothetical protein
MKSDIMEFVDRLISAPFFAGAAFFGIAALVSLGIVAASTVVSVFGMVTGVQALQQFYAPYMSIQAFFGGATLAAIGIVTAIISLIIAFAQYSTGTLLWKHGEEKNEIMVFAAKTMLLIVIVVSIFTGNIIALLPAIYGFVRIMKVL